MTVFTVTITDGPKVHGVIPVGVATEIDEEPFVGDAQHCGLTTTLADISRISSVIQLATAAVSHDGVVVHPTQSVAFQAGAAINEVLKLHAANTETALYHQTLANALLLHHIISLAIPRAMAEGVHIHDLRVVAQAVTIVNRLKLTTMPNALTRYGVALAQALATHDSFANFFGSDLDEEVGMSATIFPTFQATARTTEHVNLAAVLGVSLLVRMDLDDELAIDDDQVLNAIFMGDPLLDHVRMSAAYVDPGGGFTTWAINTRTSAVTEYQNYAFNSVTKMGHQFIGADATGLWLLDGELDDAASIPTQVRGGWMQITGSKFTSFKAAYLGLRVQDDARNFFLKIHAGDGREYVYAVRPQNMQTTKVNMGKGLRSRYFSFELVTDGADYDLDSIEFVPISSQRRV